MPSALPLLRGAVIELSDSSCIVVMPGRSGIVESPGNLSMKLELGLIQPHMAQKPVLRGEVGCACVAREVSVERGGMASAGVQGAWVGGCGREAD